MLAEGGLANREGTWRARVFHPAGDELDVHNIGPVASIPRTAYMFGVYLYSYSCITFHILSAGHLLTVWCDILQLP